MNEKTTCRAMYDWNLQTSFLRLIGVPLQQTGLTKCCAYMQLGGNFGRAVGPKPAPFSTYPF